ncbi:hypothetical protein BKA93DRAFT_725691 [Sparassis latifolia]|uniref:Uncharacterized protein n=1 Tax=Sparassis crispa TaxID=139825 RepID=A0A401GM17_9APHY|nr:hypothetical protein SCP_0502690 [Sparassis crispa]GBE83222.1 hypothetical protein SCP_0502690 [Sparassis crispa]
MRFQPLVVLSTLVALAGHAASSPTKRQTIYNYGTIDEPVVGTAIAPGETFPFEFTSVNLCESGYNPVSVWLLAEPPSDETFAVSGNYGGFASGDYLYQFGDYLIPNFGLPPMNTPVPSSLVMPDLSALGEGVYSNATLYLAVVETYLDCPPDIPAEYGVTSNAIIYNTSSS